MSQARDRILLVDLKKKLEFPAKALATTMRPDKNLYSPIKKLIVIIELTVPWEDMIEEVHETKRQTYEKPVNNCKEKGWRS